MQRQAVNDETLNAAQCMHTTHVVTPQLIHVAALTALAKGPVSEHLAICISLLANCSVGAPCCALFLSCRGANEYFKYSTGRYFKDWDIFVTEFKQKLNKTQNIPYDPAYYYRQVWPLASFQAQCDRRQ
jgi:hypothetical protein